MTKIEFEVEQEFADAFQDVVTTLGGTPQNVLHKLIEVYTLSLAAQNAKALFERTLTPVVAPSEPELDYKGLTGRELLVASALEAKARGTVTNMPVPDELRECLNWLAQA